MRIAWSGARWRQRLTRLWVWLAVVGAVAAMARPSMAVEPTGRQGILELVIDVSGSTQANDITPTRLGAIQRATLRLLDRIPPRVRVGLVSFSTTAETRARPTTDRAAVREQIAALVSNGATAIGDGLQRALNDIGTSRPPVPARVLLISDGSNTQGGDPVTAARAAAARHVPVLAVALGRPDAMVVVPDAVGGPRRVWVPPDPVLLTRITGATAGHAVAAQSAPELESALDDLLRRAGFGSEQRDLTMLFAAGALLLLAIGCALAQSQRTARSSCAGALAALVRWTSPAALLAAAGLIAVTWTHWLPTGPPPARDRSAAIAKLAAQPVPVPPASQPLEALPTPPPLIVEAANKADRTAVEQAAALLRRHGELATQRRAEIRRRHLTQIEGFQVSACDVCVASSLTSPSYGFHPTVSGRRFCDALLNMPFVRKQAQRAHVPISALVAMAMLHEQELCLRNDDGSIATFDGEQRFARKLHDVRIFDLLFAQIDAGERDWRTVEQAVATLRDHGELAAQRRGELRRRRLNQVGPLEIHVCRGCRRDRGVATPGFETNGLVGCQIVLNLSGIERDARAWGLPVVPAVASVLVHEQEHCIRDPDDRETPALDEERQLASKLGNARLLEYITAFYSDLDASGHWRS